MASARAGTDASNGRPLRVLHLLPDLAMGGGQQLVLQLVRHADLECVAPAVAYLDGPHDMRNSFTQAGTPPYHVGTSGGRAGLGLVRLLRHVRFRRPDVIHVHSGRDRKFGQVVALLTGVPVVGHLHSPWDHRGTMLPERAGRWRRRIATVKGSARDWIERRTVRAYVSAGTEVTRFHQSVAHVPIVTAVNGVELRPPRFHDEREREAARRSLDLDPGARVAICVGRLAEGKGQAQLLEMLATLDVVLLLVGDGPLGERLKHRADELGMTERVRFLGTRTDVPDLLELSDVFVFASESEGLPLVILEAMGAGLPVVALTLPGIVDVVEDGVTGFLRPHHDAAGFRAAVARLMNDRRLRETMGQGARDRVRQHFDVTTTQRLIEDVYRQVVAVGHARPGASISAAPGRTARTASGSPAGSPRP